MAADCIAIWFVTQEVLYILNTYAGEIRERGFTTNYIYMLALTVKRVAMLTPRANASQPGTQPWFAVEHPYQ